MVSIGTFEWASLRTFTKNAPKFPMFLDGFWSTCITAVLHNLALAVLSRSHSSPHFLCLDNAKTDSRPENLWDANGAKHYEMYGPLSLVQLGAFGEQFLIFRMIRRKSSFDFAASRIRRYVRGS